MPRRTGQAIDSALDAIARQPDASDRISRTLFVGLAMIESLAIYCLVIAADPAVRQPLWPAARVARQARARARDHP